MSLNKILPSSQNSSSDFLFCFVDMSFNMMLSDPKMVLVLIRSCGVDLRDITFVSVSITYLE